MNRIRHNAAREAGSGVRGAPRGSRTRGAIALLEPNPYHEETLFAFACAAADYADIAVFSPDHRGALCLARSALDLPIEWHPYVEFVVASSARTAPYDIVVLNTFPSSWLDAAGRLGSAIGAGRRAVGLVHDIAFFERTETLHQLLETHPSLTLAHAGVVCPSAVAALPASLRARVTRFVPVFRHPTGRTRDGVAVPGTIEFTRRDYGAIVRLASASRMPLRVFGRSRDRRNGREVEEVLARDRRRFNELVSALANADVRVRYDVSFREFYASVEASRFVALVPVNPQYLQGKLSGALTAGISCDVPLLATKPVHSQLVESIPSFSTCVVPFDATAPSSASEWRRLRGIDADEYRALRAGAHQVRETLIAENVATLGL